MSITYKLLQRESISKVIRFFNTAQGDKIQSNSRSEKEFEWLFFNGFFKPALYALATEDGTEDIIGTYAGIFIPMVNIDRKVVVTIKGEDTLISLDKMIQYGKRDVLKELLDFIIEKSKEDETSIFWGFSNAKAAYRRCGFTVVTQIKGSFYVTKPLKFFKNRSKALQNLSVIKKIQLLGFSWYNYMIGLMKSTSVKEFRIRKIEFNELNEDILLSFLPVNAFVTHLNKDFLRWRLIENPSPLEYGFLEIRDKDDQIKSYIIYSSNSEKIFFIEQLLFDAVLPEAKKLEIVKMALSFCRRQNAIMIRALGLNHNKYNLSEMNLLSKAGFYFFTNPEESFLIFKNLSEKEINPEDLYLSRLNTQGIR